MVSGVIVLWSFLYSSCTRTFPLPSHVTKEPICLKSDSVAEEEFCFYILHPTVHPMAQFILRVVKLLLLRELSLRLRAVGKPRPLQKPSPRMMFLLHACPLLLLCNRPAVFLISRLIRNQCLHQSPS